MAKGRTNKQGGASVSLTGDALVGNVVSGKTFYNTDPNTKLTGTLALTGDAVVAEVLSGKKFYKDDPTSQLTGTMTNQGAYNITPGATNQSIPAGYHNGSGVVAGDPDLVAGNIKSGANVFGIDGTFSGYGSILSNNRVGVPNDTVNSFMPYISIAQIKSSVAPVSLAASSNFQYLYLLTSGGVLHRSADAGKTWSNATHSSYLYVICSSSGQYVYLFQGNNNLKYSSDYGATFTEKTDRDYGVGDCSADGSIVYSDVGTRIYKSTNYGVTFSDTGIDCRDAASWSSVFQHIICSDDGNTVYYPKITTNYLWKSTDGCATAGSVVYSAGTGNSKVCVSQDGTKFAFQNKLGNGISLADSYLCGGIFNNGNYIAYSASGIRSGVYSNANYWSSLGTVLSSSTTSDINPRIKGTDAFLNCKGDIIFAIGC